MVAEGILKDVDADDGGEELPQGGRQGRPQGDDQDGHLDAAELPGRADLRGHRPRPRGRRALLHLDGLAHRGRRPRRASRSEAQLRHDHAYKVSPALDGDLDAGGQYQWRRRGEYHMYNPNTIAKLQHAVRAGSYKMFKEYTAAANDESRRLCTIRGLLRFKPGTPIPLDEVEPASRDREALQDRRHVARLDQPRGAREPGDRHEPHRRQVEHRRGRRGPGALRAATPTATSAAARSSRWPRAASA